MPFSVEDRSAIKVLRQDKQYGAETLWPPNSPDLNPVDYAVWGILQDRVYKSEVKDVEELCQRI